MNTDKVIQISSFVKKYGNEPVAGVFVLTESGKVWKYEEDYRSVHGTYSDKYHEISKINNEHR